jgi:hypothetical protein
MSKPWRQVAIPHRDIREGKFDESVFAAGLGDVVADRGPVEYRDPETFFKKTYPTLGLLKLLGTALSRLAMTGKGEAVIQLQTPFGGGKTHSLLALYHLFSHPNRIKHLDAVKAALQESGVKALPDVRVVTFDGSTPDTLKSKTPWGEIAQQVGRFDLLKEHDQKRRAPGKDLLIEVLSGKPTLIMMDEITEYAVKARDFNDQVMAFFQELTRGVPLLPCCVLVATLPSSAPYGEEGERALHQLQTIFGSVETIYTPVEGEEMYEVVRRRLFDDIGDPQEARRVADEHWQLYRRLGEDSPSEARETTYREKIRKAYPFHPELIDMLFERWSTYSTFQRTRGALRLLAEVIGDLYKREHPAPLILPSHINLGNTHIRREFIKHIGNEFEGVIAADIADSNAKAQKIDREMGSEYTRFGVASGLATSIFFYSFSAGEKKGAGSPRLRLAFLRDEIPPAVVGDALRRLEEELWYLHAENGLYHFTSQANLNRVILEREEAVKEEDIEAELRARLDRLAGSELRVTLYPAASGDVPDSRELKLAVLTSAYPGRTAATTKFVEELLGHCGTPFRTYRNTLLVLTPDANEFAGLRQKVKRALALRTIREDKGLMKNLSEENKQALESKWKDAEGGLPFGLLAAYRHLARASAEGLEWFDLGLPTVGEKGSLSRRVRDYLKGQDILLEKLKPDHVPKKTMRDQESEKPLGEIYEAFLKFPHLPILESEDVLKDAVQEGVRNGVFGLRAGGRLLFEESVAFPAMDSEAVLVRKEVAEKERATAAMPTEGETGTWRPPVLEAGPGPEPGPGPLPPPTPAPIVGVRRLSLRVQVPWEKMADFVRGVFVPLHAEGAELNVEITITAQSEEGIKKATIDHKVKETLNQIGANILEENEQ